MLALLEPTSLSKQTKNVNTNEFQACYFIKTNFSQAVDDIVANGAMAMKMKAYMEDKLRDCTASQLKNKDTSCIVRLYDFACLIRADTLQKSFDFTILCTKSVSGPVLSWKQSSPSIE